MSWRSISIEEVRLTPQEKAALEAIQGSTDIGAAVLDNVVREFVSAIASGGYATSDDGTIPDLIRLHVINRTRWLWLCEFPSLKNLQTDIRKSLNESAEKILLALTKREMSVEPPTAGTNPASGTWNSENRINMRTHPVVRPPTAQSTDYANPSND